MTNLTEVLNTMTPISLKEMDRVKLLNRTDTKFIFKANLLPSILEDITPFYSILNIDNKRTNSYQTLYYDTEDLKSYIDHHNGKNNRIKVRFRNYIESNLTFLEIKFKNNKGRTIKSRVKTSSIETSLSGTSKDFIEKYSFFEGNSLSGALWNNFTRLTLVHKTADERLTIDFNLGFKHFVNEQSVDIPHLVIAEVKQGKASLNSDFIKAIKKHHIRTSGMSKYCIGTALLNKELKSNNFKEKILTINKLKK